MEPITIIMILLGIALLVGSCFLHKEETAEPDYDEWIKRLAKRELTEEETERLRQAVDRIISEKTEEVIIKTDDYLSKVANEKIMSVDEFSKQILERLDKNNSDVMFLYNMVTETKDELKTEIANAQKVKETLQNLSAAKQTQAIETGSIVRKTEQPVRGRSVPEQEKTKKVTVKKETTEKNAGEDIAAMLAATITTESQAAAEGDLPKEKILELYRKGKSIRDISRELGMGQGEVKLVVDLYGM